MAIMKNVIKNYIYSGLGFPIELHDVEMKLYDGELYPKVDVRKIADMAIKSLILQEKRLSGNQIKFIRTYFSMTLREFSKVVNESHAAVKKWEDFKDKTTNMDPNIEILLRLYIYDNVVIKPGNYKKGKVEFYDKFVALKEIFSQQR